MAFDYNQLAQAGSLLSNLSSFGSGYNFLPKHEIITVNGLQEAKDYKLNKNERATLIDTNDDILYIKECDDIGKYNLKIYRCENVTEQYLQTNTPASISKAEFDGLKNDMNELKSMLMKMTGAGNEHNAKQFKQSEK